MKLLKPTWVSHDDLPIFSVDIHPDGSRFATGGQGGNSGRIIIWNMAPVVSEEIDSDENVPKLLCQMDNHLACVNCVRWSFSGKFLASGGDDKLVMIWKISKYPTGGVFGSKSSHAETWRCSSTLHGHSGDVLDMAWSPHDAWLASCSVDNTVIVWNALKLPEMVAVLKGHKGLVKGVAWDPVGKFMASQSDDKTLRVWRTADWQQDAVIQEPFEECGGTTHVLRLSWSPDGQYLVSAHAMNGGGPTAQIIEREGWKQDKDFVGHRKAVTCVRFNSNILQKQYRQSSKPQQYCCCAIGSRDCSLSVWLTALKRPLVVLHELFTSSVLDLSWSITGLQLMACSWDGSVAFVEFTPEELGKPLSLEEKNVLHERMYGMSLATAKAEASVVETPELLAVQEKKEIRTEPPVITVERHSNSGGSHPQPLTPHKGPTNCQIETRTTDGKRRITPMFIPPAPDTGEAPAPFGSGSNQAPAFQSSSENRPSITIKRSNDVVDPNVSRTPQKSPHRDLANAQPASISPMSKRSSIDGPDGGSGTVCGTQVTIKAGKKLEKCPSNSICDMKNDLQRGTMKRKMEKDLKVTTKIQSPKRSRLMTEDKGFSQNSLNNSPDSPQPTSYPTFEDQLGSLSLPPLLPGPKIVSRLAGDLGLKNSRRVEVENHALSSPYGPLTRVRVYKGLGPFQNNSCMPATSDIEEKNPCWESVLGCSASACAGNQRFVVVLCSDSSLHILRTDNGLRLLSPMVLPAPASRLVVGSTPHIMIVTVVGGLNLWEINERPKCLIKNESLLPLMQANTGSVVSIMSLTITDTACPLITLSSGKAYMYSNDLSTWVLLGNKSDPVEKSASQKNVHQHLSVPDLNGHPLAYVQSQMRSSFMPLNIRQPISAPQVGSICSVAFIEQQLTACEALNSAKEYRSWLLCLGKVLIEEGFETRLRLLCDDLLGPAHGFARLSKSWKSTVMGHSKHGLLREVLGFMSSNLNLQRLFIEYNEQLLSLENKKSVPNGMPEPGSERGKL